MVRSRKIVNYTWASLFLQTTTIAASSKVLLGFFFLGTDFEETVVRTRGLISVISDQSIAAEEQRGAFGMIRVTDRAVAAGAVSIPGPATDGDDDGFFVWTPICQTSVQDVGSGVNGMVYTIDSKAQRVVREGQQVALMVENIGTLNGMQIQLAIRVLSRFRS